MVNNDMLAIYVARFLLGKLSKIGEQIISSFGVTGFFIRGCFHWRALPT